MRYYLYLPESQDLYCNCYFEEKTLLPFTSTSEAVETGPLKITMKGWYTSMFYASRIRHKASDSLDMIGEIKGEAVLLCFMRKGKIVYHCDGLRSTEMTGNTNNFVYLTDCQFRYKIEKDELNECFIVLLHPDYIHQMARQYPETFASLSQRMTRQCPFELSEDHHANTPEINRIIEQIQHVEEMGSLAPFYLETKIRELLVLQLQQIRQQQCSVCACYRHYREQINEARNILEQLYQDPPGIRELSLRVGMCETMLKAGFKSLFGTTIFGYLFDYRMNKARQLLKGTGMNITEISEQSGYTYQSHFTTAFKRKFGVTPREYRSHYVT
ncbi:MAG: helix-turn-helix transcriptional regulator [Mangrovibacterium sp.]